MLHESHFRNQELYRDNQDTEIYKCVDLFLSKSRRIAQKRVQLGFSINPKPYMIIAITLLHGACMVSARRMSRKICNPGRGDTSVLSAKRQIDQIHSASCMLGVPLSVPSVSECPAAPQPKANADPIPRSLQYSCYGQD